MIHVTDLVVPKSLPEKLAQKLSEIPGRIIAIFLTYGDDNYRVIWEDRE